MREILFRGKRKDNGKWVKGYYSYETDECSFELHLISDNKSVVTEVVPETVGQYTNLVDKNGSKIFEGDILRVSYSDGNNITEATGSVKFLNGCYIIDSTVFHNYRLEEFFSLEKIGNVYDKF